MLHVLKTAQSIRLVNASHKVCKWHLKQGLFLLPQDKPVRLDSLFKIAPEDTFYGAQLYKYTFEIHTVAHNICQTSEM